MPTSRSFQKTLRSLEDEMKNIERGIQTEDERRAFSRLLANRLGHVVCPTRDQAGHLTQKEGGGVCNLARAAVTALKGQPAPKAILHYILRAIRELNVLR